MYEAEFPQSIELLFGFYAFGHDTDTQLLSQQTHQVHYVLGIVTVAKLSHETLVNLDAIEWKTIQMAEG